MAIEAARLTVRVDADTDPATSKLDSFGSKMNTMARSMGAIGLGLSAGITAPLIGIATAANTAGTALNREMGNVQSLGIAQTRVEALKASVQSMSIETGKSTTDLAQGLYQVISAFGDSADTADILRINAKAAGAGLATVSESLALTSAVTKGYGDTSAEAVQHSADLALMSVQLGQTTFPELAASMGLVTPLAAALGVTQEELFATMATGAGVTGSTSQVATQFRGVLQSLMAPTEDMTDLIASQGYASGKAMVEQLGMADTLKIIIDTATASNVPLQKFIGSIEGQTLAMALAGPQAEDYLAKIAQMGNSTGAMDAAFSAQTTGVNAAGFAAEQAAAKWQVFLQKLNDGLAPAKEAAITALGPIMDTVLGLADAFANADPATQTWIVGIGAAVAAAGPLLIALAGVAAAVSAIGLPLILIGAGIVALAAVWYFNIGGIRDATTAAWAAIEPTFTAWKDWLLTTLPGAYAAVKDAAVAAWDSIKAVFSGKMTLPELVQKVTVEWNIPVPTLDMNMNFATNKNFKGIGDAVAQQIIDGWKNAPWADLTASMTEKVNALTLAIEGTDWSGLGTQVGQNIRNAIAAAFTTGLSGTDLGLGLHAPEVAKSLGAQAERSARTPPTVFEQFRSSDMGAQVQGLLAAADKLSTAFAEGANDFITNLTAGLVGFDWGTPAWIEDLKAWWEGMTTPGWVTALGNWLDLVASIVPGWVTSIGNFITSLAASPDWVGIAQAWVDKLFGIAPGWVTTIRNAIDTFFGAGPGWLSTFNSIVDKLLGFSFGGGGGGGGSGSPGPGQDNMSPGGPYFGDIPSSNLGDSFNTVGAAAYGGGGVGGVSIVINAGSWSDAQAESLAVRVARIIGRRA